MSPTRWPRRERASARFAATVLFPTPPFPDATATLKRTSGSSAASGGGTPTAPRGGIGAGSRTSSWIVTAWTPGSERRRSVASRRISSAARGDDVCISSRNEPLPPPTWRSLTKPNETMSRDSPGKRIVFRTSRTFSSESSAAADMGEESYQFSVLSSRLQRPARFVAQDQNRFADLLRDGVALANVPPGDLDRLSDGDDDGAGADVPRVPRQDPERARDAGGKDRKPGLQRQMRGAALERKQLAVPRACLLRKDHQRPAARELPEPGLDRCGAAGPVSPV